MTTDTASMPAVRRALLELARLEDEKATAEAASVPYWSACPSTVQGHRLAANALRAAADSLLQAC